MFWNFEVADGDRKILSNRKTRSYFSLVFSKFSKKLLVPGIRSPFLHVAKYSCTRVKFLTIDSGHSFHLFTASYNVTDWWLSYWVANQKDTFNPVTNKTESDYKYYLTIYGGIGAGNSFFTLVRSFVFAFAGILAAYRMHDNLLSKVIRGTLAFFDATPSGRILNRFAKDVPSVDGSLPFMLNILLACIFRLIGTLVVICYGLPWFCLLLLFITPLYYFIQRFYRSTSR